MNEKLFKVFCLALIFAGSILRFSGLEKKQYWKDEAGSSMVTTGHRIYDLFGDAKGGTFPAGKYLELQNSSPQHGPLDTAIRLATEESSHAPLYYLALRGWISGFGDSVMSTRSFSAVISLAIIPATYFLCLSLFGSSVAAWTGAMLAAVSPFQFIFAQDTREYILWLLMTIVSSAALLEERWRRYLIFCFLDIYSSFWALFVAAGQMAFLFFNQTPEDRAKSRLFLRARLVTAVIAMPVLINMISHLSDIRRSTAWMQQSPGWNKYLRALLTEIYRVFFDLNIPSGFAVSDYPFQTTAIICVLLLELGAIASFFRTADRRRKSFVLCLILSGLIPTMGLDLLFGGRRALSARFLLTFFLAIQLTVIYLLSRQIQNPLRYRQWSGKLMAAALGLLGVYSIFINSQSQSWWNKGLTGDYRFMAKFLNDAPSPQLIISQDTRESIAISRYLNPTIEIMSAPPFPSVESLKPWRSVFILFGEPEDGPDFYRTQGVKTLPVNGSLWSLER